MDEKTLVTLEYHKILERLAGYAAFSLSAELGRALLPSTSLDEIQARQARTTEARLLLNLSPGFSIGGARDVRSTADLAQLGGVLEPASLVDIKNTLVAARDLARGFERQAGQYPWLDVVAARLPPPSGLIDTIGRALSDRGEVLDQASERLAGIRSELKTAHARLLARLERLVNDPRTASMLQEPIITLRNGRYVVPLRIEFKSRLRSIVHDQSASGATLFVEPLVTVELNNRWHELMLAERDEERRILSELSRMVGENAAAIKDLVLALAELDLALMCARYAEDLRAAEPLLVEPQPTEGHPGSVIRLYQARHPLLDPQTVVPVDVDLDQRTFSLVITGPNTGGKTVTLKTVGLLALMAQSGLHIPAQSGSSLSIFSKVFADIGDEQSIEQSLSTFSGHITNIVRMLKRAGCGTLVLLDELGAGTDPQEGAALARSILDYLVTRHIPNLVATHYPELKTYAHVTPGVVNASMEFDLKSLRPTYHLVVGLPGRSNALLIAERLGLPGAILDAARAGLSPDDLRAEDLLDEIHRQRDLARQARRAAEEAQAEAETHRRELAQRLEKIEDERLALLEEARVLFAAEAAGLREEIEQARRELSRARQPLESIKRLQQDVEALEAAVQQPVVRRKAEGEAASPLRVGEKVRLSALKTEGIVAAISEAEVEVQLGNLRVRARLDEIERRTDVRVQSQERKPAAPPPPTISFASRESPGMELTLRGMRVEEALDALDHYIDNAYFAGMPFVRIIHGKGTGRLRQAVRQALHQSPHIQKWETGMDSEGGEGVTIAHLAAD
ncbi:MAG: endonuclease MutS2 [Anaerolineaceae bacterium]|nr:endonuclease MutS2 [Anaerolineaceae bacterium]